jgi:hypothetical protein
MQACMLWWSLQSFVWDRRGINICIIILLGWRIWGSHKDNGMFEKAWVFVSLSTEGLTWCFGLLMLGPRFNSHEPSVSGGLLFLVTPCKVKTTPLWTWLFFFLRYDFLKQTSHFLYKREMERKKNQTVVLCKRWWTGVILVDILRPPLETCISCWNLSLIFDSILENLLRNSDDEI